VVVVQVQKKKNKTYNLQNYRLAQLHTKNLKAIEEILINAVVELKPYMTYKSVQRVIGEIQNQMSLIDAHLTEFNKIEESKGEVEEEHE